MHYTKNNLPVSAISNPECRIRRIRDCTVASLWSSRPRAHECPAV